jgi:para-aminobenzoate synthetase component 1
MPQLVSPSALGLSAPEFERRALHWAAGHTYCAYYVPAGPFSGPGGAFKHVLAVANEPKEGQLPGPGSLGELQRWLTQPAAAPRCGFLTYELKNEIEALISENPDALEWPLLHFFEAEAWLYWRPDGTVEVHGPGEVLTDLLAFSSPAAPAVAKAPPLRPRLPRSEYLQAVADIREDILNGEVYELNLCQEFFVEEVRLSPVDTFLQLLAASPTPFAGFYKHQQQYLLCASPERFVQRVGAVLLSQPIKGTVRRGTSEADDAAQRQRLFDDEKERAENLMIVDLVRNDLARVAETGSVQVPELFGLYGFRHVWQMISSVTATARPGTTLADVLRAAFPMGSMTGAPKIRAMQLIERYERSRRGLYSGSIGYVWPNGDFDFNVVIRSLFYRADTGYLSFQVGSAITYDSVPEQEYEECLLKARALLEVLETSIGN